MKRFQQIIAITAVIALIFTLGYLSGSTSKELNIMAEVPAVNQTPVQAPVQTTAPTTQTAAPDAETTEPEQNAPSSDESTEAAQPSEAPSENTDSSANSLDKVVNAVNALKKEQNVKAVKTEKTVINITDCSASALTNVLNGICQKVAGEKVTTYDFSGGQAVGIGSDGKEANDGKSVSPNEVLPPKNNDFKLSESGVKEIKEDKNGDSTTYTITLIDEESTLDKNPVNNEEAVGFLNLGGFNIPTVTITQADIDYPETVITVTLNKDGKVTLYKYEQPMEGSMGCKITLVSASAEFDGGNYETWEFTY